MMCKLRVNVCLLVSIFFSVLSAQELHPPFDFQLLLSGNFGELRSNHFHGGLDFKTQGAVGKPIRCVADGYVSRITVTPGGYGRGLYVTHPSLGLTTIYGHLDAFIPEIAALVNTYQYDNETFAVDIRPDSTRFCFKKGDLLAFAGNSGYSFGPHLHFEVRHTETNETVDPLPYFYSQIKDSRPPLARAIRFYPQPGQGVVNGKREKQTFDISSPNASHCLKSPIEAWGNIGLGIKAYDYMDDASNTYGVRVVRLLVDSVELFRSTVDRFLFSENRLINSWTDYAESRRNSWFMKSFVEPGNPLRMLQADQNRGILHINEERTYRITYVLEDLYGNRSNYHVRIRGVSQPIPEATVTPRHNLRWDRVNVVQEPGMHLVIPRQSLYDDVALHTVVKPDTGALSLQYTLHCEPIPLHRASDLYIALRAKPQQPEKCYIARVGKKGSQYVGGTYEDGWLHTSILELGTYCVLTDTIPPNVTPINKANWKKTRKLVYRIGDKESGIHSYRGEINGRFALFEYDAKSGRLICYLDKSKYRPGTELHLVLEVKDNRGNTTRLEERLGVVR